MKDFEGYTLTELEKLALLRAKKKALLATHDLLSLREDFICGLLNLTVNTLEESPLIEALKDDTPCWRLLDLVFDDPAYDLWHQLCSAKKDIRDSISVVNSLISLIEDGYDAGGTKEDFITRLEADFETTVMKISEHEFAKKIQDNYWKQMEEKSGNTSET